MQSSLPLFRDSSNDGNEKTLKQSKKQNERKLKKRKNYDLASVFHCDRLHAISSYQNLKVWYHYQVLSQITTLHNYTTCCHMINCTISASFYPLPSKWLFQDTCSLWFHHLLPSIIFNGCILLHTKENFQLNKLSSNATVFLLYQQHYMFQLSSSHHQVP
jgi:hypothetical protein